MMGSIARSTDPSADIDLILSAVLHLPSHEAQVTIPRIKQRISLTQQWQIAEGEHLLDIGCGQGESTAVLATAVGETGHVVGIDVILNYGSPYSIRDSWTYLSSSALGPRISLECTDTAAHLRSAHSANDKQYDAAVLCHSLFYFSDLESVFSLFRTLAEHKIRRVYVAEYSSEASFPSQEAHILAAQTQALYHSYKMSRTLSDRDLNVRAAPDKQAILKAASEVSYGLHREGIVTPEPDLLEGHYECRFVTSQRFQKLIEVESFPPDRETEIFNLAHQVKESMDKLLESGVLTVRSMNVWYAVFDLQVDC